MKLIIFLLFIGNNWAGNVLSGPQNPEMALRGLFHSQGGQGPTLHYLFGENHQHLRSAMSRGNIISHLLIDALDRNENVLFLFESPYQEVLQVVNSSSLEKYRYLKEKYFIDTKIVRPMDKIIIDSWELPKIQQSKKEVNEFFQREKNQSRDILANAKNSNFNDLESNIHKFKLNYNLFWEDLSNYIREMRFERDRALVEKVKANLHFDHIILVAGSKHLSSENVFFGQLFQIRGLNVFTPYNVAEETHEVLPENFNLYATNQEILKNINEAINIINQTQCKGIPFLN